MLPLFSLCISVVVCIQGVGERWLKRVEIIVLVESVIAYLTTPKLIRLYRAVHDQLLSIARRLCTIGMESESRIEWSGGRRVVLPMPIRYEISSREVGPSGILANDCVYPCSRTPLDRHRGRVVVTLTLRLDRGRPLRPKRYVSTGPRRESTLDVMWGGIVASSSW